MLPSLSVLLMSTQQGHLAFERLVFMNDYTYYPDMLHSF